MQIRFVLNDHAVHSIDWSYAIITTACPEPNDPIVVFEADAWNPGFSTESYDEYETRTSLDSAVNDGLSRNAMYVSRPFPPSALELLQETSDYYLFSLELHQHKGM